MPQSGSFHASTTMRAASCPLGGCGFDFGTVGFAACVAGFTASQRQRTALLKAALRFAWISRTVDGANGRQVCPAWRRPPHRSRHRRSWAYSDSRVSASSRLTDTAPSTGVEQLPSGSLRVSVYAGIDPVSKKRHYFVETVPAWPSAARDAERVRTRLLNQIDERRNPRTKASVNQLLDRWLEVAEMETTTRNSVVGRLDRHVRPVQFQPHTINATKVRDLRDGIREILRGQALSTGSRLGESNPRPTHYEVKAVRSLHTVKAWRHLLRFQE
jgi:hypothetical protein